jgi:hypothetical protein
MKTGYIYKTSEKKQARDRKRREDPAYRAKEQAYNQKRREDPAYREKEQAYNQKRREDPAYREKEQAYNQAYNRACRFKVMQHICGTDVPYCMSGHPRHRLEKETDISALTFSHTRKRKPGELTRINTKKMALWLIRNKFPYIGVIVECWNCNGPSDNWGKDVRLNSSPLSATSPS